jgi:hypothetical protein
LLGGEPTDDSPTVISKTAVKAAPAEDAFTGSLRGRRLAHFELIEPIGVGGMAAVIRARDTQLDREVALKILPPEMAADPENVRRFHQEARSAAKLDHETIARVFFCGEDQRLHFIAFEFVEGENLRALIDKRGRLPAGAAVSYMLQIASGLTHAAGRGVVHRDIKPSNIIITPAGKAKLVDMGLARSLERSRDDGLTQSGVTLGTFDYISPEQALEPRDADVRSDIYSFGCTFYHALTGQPPVPEGTAAKKLHHHHHVKPADPRQLAPDLPDVVAMILGRMMAKRPVDRYQTPEHLIQDLLLAARGLGISAEVPEGTPVTAAAWPGPPAVRPLLLAGVAALVVVGLVLLADPGGTTPPVKPVASVPRTEGGGSLPPEPPEPTAPKATKPKPAPRPDPKTPRPALVREVYDGPARADALMQWAADARAKGATELEVVLPGDLTLVADSPEHPCLSFEASRVIVRPKTPGPRPTIRLNSGGGRQQSVWAALTVAGDDVSVEGLRFVVDAQGGNYEMVGLRLLGRGKHLVKNCEFVQVMPSFEPLNRLASVRAEGAGGRSSLGLEECLFLGYGRVDEVTRPGMGQPAALEPFRVERGGQDAVVRRGPVRVVAENCAFGPHAAAFRFEEAPANPEAGRAEIRHCSVLLGADSAAFDVAEKANADLQVEACLFSRPRDAVGMGPAGPAAVLLHQAAPASVSPVVFRGRDNRYHNLDGFWLTGDGPPATSWTDFPRRLQETGGRDLRSFVLLDSPWKDAEPLKMLEQPPPARPGPAFRPNEQLADVRVRGPDGRETVAGVQRLGGDDFTAGVSGLTPQRPFVMGRRDRVVDPDAEPSAEKRTYKRLEDALLDARPGDVILLRCRRITVGPVRLDRRPVDVTIRPAPGFRPELVVNDTAGAPALFTLRDGSLRLQDLEIRLQPGDDTKSLAVVSLDGSAQCSFKGCAITLDRPGAGLAVAAVPESAAGAESRPPLLSLEDCFVRGDGDVVRDRSGRAFELRAKNTLAVLNGSFLCVESGADAPAPGQWVQATLGKVTAYLTDHLVRLQAGKEHRMPVPVHCDAKSCVFVAAAGRALVHLDGPETNEDRLKDRLSWTGEGNAFGNLKDRMFDQVMPGSDEMTMSGPTVGAERWKSLFREDGNSQFLPGVQFAEAAPDGQFSRVKSPQMRLVSPKEVGAELAVPMPADDEDR